MQIASHFQKRDVKHDSLWFSNEHYGRPTIPLKFSSQDTCNEPLAWLSDMQPKERMSVTSHAVIYRDAPI
jgi:hypothetical protein